MEANEARRPPEEKNADPILRTKLPFSNDSFLEEEEGNSKDVKLMSTPKQSR